MITVKRSDSTNVDFLRLINDLDSFLESRHKEEHAFCKQYNRPESIRFVVLVYDESGNAVGCGAIRSYLPDVMEIKRMFVSPYERKRGVAQMILHELENWAAELGAKKCILETGTKLSEAIRLYERFGYNQIPNYGQYKDVEGSLCFEKFLPTISKAI